MLYLKSFLLTVLDIANEMSPYLLLGFLIAGLLHAFVPNRWYVRHLSGSRFSTIVNAALIGIPLPLCSCGVIPTAMGLRREGASRGAVTSFLIATPQTGVDSILATSAVMGWPFAIIRPIVALLTALLGGALVNRYTTDADDEPVTATHQAQRQVSEQPLTFAQRMHQALSYSMVEMMEDIGKWLVVGLVVAGLITAMVPDEWLAACAGNTWLSMLVVLVISIPMYVCATGSIPIAVALMLKGLTPGSALVLLMAGPAVNVASVLVIHKVMGKRTLLLYLASIIAGALLCGAAIDCLMPAEWFIATLSHVQGCAHDDAHAGWLAWTCTAVLTLLLLNVWRLKLTHHGHEHCHCH